MTDLAAGALFLTVAAGGAETDLIALAQAVAGNHGFGAIDQCVAVIVGWTATLSYMIHHLTAGALSARLATVARTCVSDKLQLQFARGE